MFHRKNTKIGRTGRKNFSSSLAILFCTLVIASTTGNSFGIRNSFAQQLQTQQSPTIAYKSPWNINLQMSSVNGSQPLCAAGVCNQSFYPAIPPENTASSTIPQTKNGDPTVTPLSQPTIDPTKKTLMLTNTFSNTRTPSLTHSFQGDFILGPDTFRFINSYWTPYTSFNFPFTAPGTGNCPASSGSFSASVALKDIINKLDRSSNDSGVAAAALAATHAFPYILPTNPAGQVDRGEPATLAILLQYQGVGTQDTIDAGGITAALKLPPGFEAWGQGNKYVANDIAFSNFNAIVHPNDAIVLCFGPINILHKAPLATPVVGILGLHYWRDGDTRTINDNINTDQTLSAVRQFTLSSGQNSTMFTNTFNPDIHFKNGFDRTIPAGIVNQVTPVIFQVTGRAGPVDSQMHQMQQDIPAAVLCKGTPVTYSLSFTNLGDVPVNNFIATASTNIPAALSSAASAGGSDVTPPPAAVASLVSPYLPPPAALVSPSWAPTGILSPPLAGAALVNQAAASLASPLSILGASTFNVGTIAPHDTEPATGSPSRAPPGSLILHSSASCKALSNAAGTVAGNLAANPPLYITQTYTNSIGQRFTEVKQLNVPTVPG